ncbi:MAG TPA: hypothetical protein VGJ68_20060 [Bradyrhizobium sp.]
MLDLIGTTVITAAIVLNLNAAITMMPLSSAQKLTAVAIAGLWIGLAIALAATGVYADVATPVPAIGMMAGLPLVVAAIAVLSSAKVREALLALPVPGLNIMRIFGAFFLLLAAQGRLGGPFPQSAGWGDVIVSVAAVPLTLAVARDITGHRGALLAWNLFGTLDLIAALTLGIMSAPGSPLQLFGGAIGSTAVTVLPWSNIPTLLVPFYLITHGLIFAHLARANRAAMA